MDELLQRALERREHLRNELAAVESFIKSYGALKDTQAPRRTTQADLFAARPARQGTRAARARANAAAMDEAERLILAAGRPLSRTTLLRELQKAGHEIEGGDKSKVLGTNLWRSKRFHSLKGAGYWPKSVPIPPEFNTKPKRPSMLDDLA